MANVRTRLELWLELDEQYVSIAQAYVEHGAPEWADHIRARLPMIQEAEAIAQARDTHAVFAELTVEEVLEIRAKAAARKEARRVDAVQETIQEEG